MQKSSRNIIYVAKCKDEKKSHNIIYVAKKDEGEN